MRRLLLIICAASALALPARADDMEQFGFGARAQGMGNAYTALASDGTATYWNPAGLILSRHLNLTLGFSYADYGLTFDSNSPDLDDDVERIVPLSALSMAISTTIPFDIPDRFAFGLGIFLPTRGIVNVETSADAARPEWFAYGERQDRVHVLPSLAVKATKWLSFGLGASIFVDAAGGTTISAGVAAPVQPEFELKLKPDAGVVVGVLLQPSEWLSVGLTYRSELSFKLDFPASAVVQGINIPLQLETITFFTPHQLSFGVALSPTDSLILTLDLHYFMWSAYDDPFLVVTSSVAATPTRVEVDLRDSFSPRLGAELLVTDWLLLRGGYAYRSSPVPSQDFEPTNLVDGERHSLTTGVGFLFGKPGEEATADAKAKGPAAQTITEATKDASYDLDFFFQLHWHPEVEAEKAAGAPVSSWEADGIILNFGLSFTARF